MDKKGLIKKGFLIVIPIIIFFLIFFLNASFADEESYRIGDFIKIHLEKNDQLKVTSPSQTFIKNDVEGDFLFYFREEGKHVIEVKNGNSKRENVFDINVDSSEIEQNNPQINEINTSKEVEEKVISKEKKEIKITSNNRSNANITSKLEMEVNSASKIKIYDRNEDKFVDFEPIDSDGNGLYDTVVWETNLTGQTFEIIIEIVSAEHLNTERNFIENIYEQVKEKDEVWSPTILENEYVRLSFERNLTSENDITIVPRVVLGKPRIEVYKKDGSEKIAEFSEIFSGVENKVYLEKLIGEEYSFDLRIIGGEVEFDYITDPSVGGTETGGLRPQSLACFSNGGTGTCLGTYPSTCPSAGGADYLSCSDGQRETQYTSKSNYAGVDATYFNSSISCGEITRVQMCYTWSASGNDASNCYIDIDAGDSVWVRKVASCPGAAGASGCIDVTSDKSWVCSNFFGASGTRARISARMTATLSRSTSMYTDALYFNVTYNPPAPLVTITNPKNQTYGSINFPLPVNVSLNENGSAVFYSLNGTQNVSLGTTNNRNYSALISSLSDGNYTLRIYANNTYGIRNDSQTVNFSVDVTAPTISIVSPIESNFYSAGSIYFNISTNENSSANFTMNNGVANYTMTASNGGTYFSYLNNSVPNGNYSARFFVADIYGNRDDSKRVNFSVDTTFPRIDYSAGTENNDTNFSRNWVFVNVSIVETNEANITFGLYNSAGSLVRENVSSSGLRAVNWTGLTDGVYYYNVTVVDVVAHRNSTLTRKIRLDGQAPSVRIFNPENRSYNLTSFDLNFSASDGSLHSCWYSDNFGSTNISLTECQNTTYTAPEGTTTIILFANDTAGNTNSSNVTFFVDSIFPRIDYSTGTETNDTNFSRNWVFVNVSIVETNEANITFGLYNSAGSLVRENVSSSGLRAVNWTGLTDGVYYYNVTVVDVVAHRNSTLTRKIRLDNIGPVINIVNPRPIIYNFNLSIPLDYNVYDNGVGTLDRCWWNLNGGVNQSINCGENTTFDAPEGNTNITFYANDSLGNVNSNFVSFLIDLKVPSIELLTPFNGKYIGQKENVEFGFYPSDERGIDACALYGNWSGWELKQLNLSAENITNNYFYEDMTGEGDGSYVWNVWCNNSIGSYAYAAENFTFTLDTINPSIEFGEGTEDHLSNFSRNWVFVNVSIVETNEANITFGLYNSAGSLVRENVSSSGLRAVNWTGLTDGVYYYNVTVVDVVAHRNSTTTRAIEIDTRGPGITIESPVNTTYINFPVPINITLDEPATSVIYSLDEGQNISLNQAGPLNYGTDLNSLAEGSHILRFYSTDDLGNINGSESIIFSIDTLGPEIIVISPEEGHFHAEHGVNFNISTNEASTANYSLDGGLTNHTMESNLEGTFFGAINDSIPDGDYAVNFYVSDIYGNRNESVTVHFHVHNHVPMIEFTAPTPENERISSNTSFVINVSFEENELDSIWISWNGINETLTNSNSESYWTTKNDLAGGDYIFQVFINDSAGFFNQTEIRTIHVDLVAPQWSEINQTRGGSYSDRFYRGTPQNLSALWTDNYKLGSAWLSTDETGTWKNYTETYNSSQILIGTQNRSFFLWENDSKTTGDTVNWRIYANDSVGNVNATSQSSFTLWGFSEISDHFMFPTGVKVGNTSRAYCKISGNFTGTALSNYNVSFYHEDSYLGSNLTLADGYTSILVNIAEAGSHAIKCNISDKNEIFYTASENNEGISYLGVGFSERIYNFENSTYNRAYEGTSNTTTTLIDEPYNVLESKNEIYQVYRGGQGVYSYSRFEFKVDEPIEEISRLNITWHGYGTAGGTNPKGYILYFYNVSSSTWVQLASYTTNGANRTETFAYTTAFNNFINNTKYVKILVRSASPGATGGGGADRWTEVGTDYVHVAVRSDIIPPEVTLNSPGTLFKTNNNTIEFNCSAVDDYKLANISLYGNWTGTWAANETNTSGRTGNYKFIKNISEGIYSWNCYVCDGAGNCEFSAFDRTISIDKTAPKVNLIYPISTQNFSALSVDSFNVSVVENNSLINCSIFGDWNGGWALKETLNSPLKYPGAINFSSANVVTDGFYKWNVECNDDHGNKGRNSTNFTFAAFLPPYQNPQIQEINQSKNDGTGDVEIRWDAISNAVKYRVYSSSGMNQPFVLINETNETYHHESSDSSARKFYKVSAWNPTDENMSSEVFSKSIYTLKRKDGVNTRNWVGFYSNNSDFVSAGSLLSEINNITSINMWNATIQKRVSCNTFSCPSFPECTDTNCNFSFNMEAGLGYEVTLNTTAPLTVNWSYVGKVASPATVSLLKNNTGFGKNWVSIYANTTINNAGELMSSIDNADAVTSWDATNQLSKGLVPSPFPWAPYLGTNFPIELEKGYEISVTQSGDWTQE